MIKDKIAIALKQMQHDIEDTNTFKSMENRTTDNDPWIYYICITAKDDISLEYASRLLNSLNIKVKQIIMIPATYKISNLDCITISKTFGSLQHIFCYNIECLSILDADNRLENSGDFYISVIRENKNTGKNDIISYRSLLSIIDDMK